MEEPKIGVFICHCGTNIAGTVDIDEVREFAAGLPGVVSARDYKFTCSEPGQLQIKEDVKNLGLNRVVVAACSPRMHEITFRKAVAEVGLNPYLLQIANIREQDSWVHKNGSTEKAKALIRAAVQRANLLESLERREVPVTPSVLVVGGGIAGIQAALNIANANHKVYLVEREPSIGGRMIQLDKTFPTLDCSSCILTPKMAAVGSHPNIELMTYSEVEDVSGYIGNFKVKVRKKPRYVDSELCTGCGICIEKCPWKTDSEFDMGLGKRKAVYTPFPQAVPNVPVIDPDVCVYFEKGTCRACEKFCPPGAIAWDQKEETVELEVGAIIVATGYDLLDPSPLTQYGYKRLDNVITSLEFERMCSATGPTGGELVLKDGSAPQSVAIIHCVGSRDKNYCEYCSRVCCMYALKYSHLIGEKTDADVYQLYIDMRCYGKGFEEFYKRLSDEGVNFVRGKVAQVTDQVAGEEEQGKLVVVTEDTLLGRMLRIPVDMVILCPAMVARADADEVARRFLINRGADGFFLERHPKLEPVATASDGVFVVGCAQGPKDIPDTVAQASAGAAEALSLIDRGTVEIEAATAVVDEEMCSGCKICLALCPYNAITFDEEKKLANVNDILCKGCGVCVAACPSAAITGRHFTDKQIFAEIDGLLADVKPPLVAV
ncbi:MAG: disulfide reductase [Dehalococcoidia bacterium SM23_28_2]|nr:MAG: disulfide reductase [Dehalococcoidia bacterium SM23_28_2]